MVCRVYAGRNKGGLTRRRPASRSSRQPGEDQRQGRKMARNIFSVSARNSVWAARNNIRAVAGSSDAMLRRDVAAMLFYRNNVRVAASRSDAARNIFRAASGSERQRAAAR